MRPCRLFRSASRQKRELGIKESSGGSLGKGVLWGARRVDD
jgi:hypothetical protein